MTTVATRRPWAGAAAAQASVDAAEREARVGLRADDIFLARDFVDYNDINILGGDNFDPPPGNSVTAVTTSTLVTSAE